MPPRAWLILKLMVITIHYRHQHPLLIMLSLPGAFSEKNSLGKKPKREQSPWGRLGLCCVWNECASVSWYVLHDLLGGDPGDLEVCVQRQTEGISLNMGFLLVSPNLSSNVENVIPTGIPESREQRALSQARWSELADGSKCSLWQPFIAQESCMGYSGLGKTTERTLLVSGRNLLLLLVPRA